MFCLGHKDTLDSPQVLLKFLSKQDGLWLHVKDRPRGLGIIDISDDSNFGIDTFSLVLLMDWRSYLPITTSNGTLTQRTCKSAQIPS